MRRLRSMWVVAVCVASCACIGFRGPEDLRRDLVQATGVELDRTTGVTVGRMGVAMVRWFTPEKEIPLKGVHKVQVGVYDVVGAAERGIPDYPLIDDWDPLVRIHDEDEDIFVLIRQDEKRIRAMLVVVADTDEWVLVRLKGNLDRVVESAMRMAFEQAKRPELADPAIADYRTRTAASSAPEPS